MSCCLVVLGLIPEHGKCLFSCAALLNTFSHSCQICALVLNPQTGLLSSQFHVIFDDTFSTVSHMRDETIPPTWEDMCNNATESATGEAFNLAEVWFKELTHTSEDPIDNPFKIIPGQFDLSASDSKEAANSRLDSNHKGAKAGAADNASKSNSKSKEKKAVSFCKPKPLENEGGILGMPQMTNLSESGLHQSEHICKLNVKKSQEASRRPNESLLSPLGKSLACSQYYQQLQHIYHLITSLLIKMQQNTRS